MASRERFLQADDEDELMALQAELQARGSTPAATVTRIKKRTPGPSPSESAAHLAESSPTSCCSSHPHCAHSDNPPAVSVDDLMASMQSAMKGIVGEVQERSQQSAQPPAVPIPPRLSTTAGAAFPAAMHRKQSKFSLARQRKGAEGPASAPASDNNKNPAPAQPFLPAVPSQLSPVATSATDAESISAETSSLLAAMSPEQVAAAREEVLSRLPPAAAEFLRRRGAQKAAAGASGSAGGTVGGTAVTVAKPEHASSLNTNMNASNNSNQSSENKPNSDAEQRGVALTTTPTATPSSQTLPQSSDISKSHASTFQTGPSSISSSASMLAGCLRFDVKGQVVGLKALKTPTTMDTTSTSTSTNSGGGQTPAGSRAAARAELDDVISRDPIRQAEGQAPVEGYTIEEACLLARSSVVPQRLFALRLLRSILLLAKPSGDATINSTEVPVPTEFNRGAAKVNWEDVWRHAMHVAQVPVIVRIALDDRSPVVIAAAADALEALLRPSPIVYRSIKAAEENPVIGWPSCPARHLQRPNASTPWVVAPVDLQARRKQKEKEKQEAVQAGVLPGEESDDVNEKDLSKVDPMTGLLNMDLLERLNYVLSVLRTPGATAPLLSVISSVCSAGQDAARIAAENVLPGLQVALETTPNLRPLVLKTLHSICQASPHAAHAVHASASSILSSLVLPHLLQGPMQHAPHGEIISSLYAVEMAEALQIWRALSLYRLPLVSGDDAYPSLCRYLTPEVDISSSKPSSISDASIRASIAGSGWVIAREAYLVLAQLRDMRAGDDQQERMWMSRECSTAVASQTLQWVESLPLMETIEVLQQYLDQKRYCNRDGDGTITISTIGTQAEEERKEEGALQSAVLSALGAALHFLASHWAAAAAWCTSEDKAAARTALQRAKIFLPKVVDSSHEAPSSSSKNKKGSSIPHALGALLQSYLEESSREDSSLLIANEVFTTACSLALCIDRLEVVLSDTAPCASDAMHKNSPPNAAGAVALAPFITAPAISAMTELTCKMDTTLLQPWDMPCLETSLQLARCIAAAGRIFPGQSAATAALTALRALPPGADDTALQLMAQCLTGDALNTPLKAVYEYINENMASLSLLAASETEEESNGGAGKPPGQVKESGSAEAMLPEMPAADAMGQVLLAGYAGVWLGFVQEEGPSTGDKDLAPAYTQALFRPQGSSLPLVAGWPLHHPPTPPPGSHNSAPPSTATAYALLWTLALQLEQQSPNSALPEHPSGAVITTVKLVFDPEPAPSYLAPPSSDLFSSDDVWRDPLVRWALAAVLQVNMQSLDKGKLISDPVAQVEQRQYQSQFWTVPQARQLVESYCASSFGDALFGGAVALLFNSYLAPMEVQLEVLACLSDGRAIHLLPPLRACPGPSLAYLEAPVSEEHLRAARDAYLKILESPDALKCLETGSIVLSIVVHRMAGMIFYNQESKEKDKVSDADNEMEVRRRHALLCGVIRRLRSPGALPVLGMLLRWNCEEGAAVDAVPAERMEFLDAACNGDGGEGLFKVVMEALEA